MTVKVIDITNWQPVEESTLGSFYSEGSLSKHLLEYEENYYLFKETWTRNRQGGYFDKVNHQFWSEIIAAAIANIMELNIPDTYVGINNSDKISFNVGVLNKWFLNKNDSFTKGSELFNRHIDNYNEQKYNLNSAIEFTSHINDSLNYWMKLMFFDALIGNTDRHHENWGVINDDTLSPLYDNGISLGWRINDSNFSSTTIEKHMHNFKFKMKVSSTCDNKTVSSVINYFLSIGKNSKEDILDFINKFNSDALIILKEKFCTMEHIPIEYRLTNSRFDFIVDYVNFRAKILKEMVENHSE